MPSLNKVTIIGHVGDDAQMRFTPSGRPVTSFNVAAGRSYTTSDGERRDETEWFTVVTWGKLAKTCNQFVAKGRQVYAEGSIKLKTWEGQDGQKHSKNEITAQTVLFLGKREERTEAIDELAPEDLPF